MFFFRMVGFLSGVIWILFSVPSEGAELPIVTGPVIYLGTQHVNNESYFIQLYLGKSHGFMVREKHLLPNGRVFTRESTGKWHQIRDKAFLQLTNNNDFYQIMNIGGTGNLYRGLQFSNGMTTTVVLKQKLEEQQEYTFLGTLYTKEQTILAEDINNAVTYNVKPGKIVSTFLREQKNILPVEITVLTTNKDSNFSLDIQKIQNIQYKIKKESYNRYKYFLNAIVGNLWKITNINNNELAIQYKVSFQQDIGKNSGIIEIFDGEKYTTGSYTIRDKQFLLSADTDNVLLGTLTQRTMSWELFGEVLELRADKEIFALLEKVR